MWNKDRVRGLPGKPPWDARGCTWWWWVVVMWLVGGACIGTIGQVVCVWGVGWGLEG